MCIHIYIYIYIYIHVYIYIYIYIYICISNNIGGPRGERPDDLPQPPDLAEVAGPQKNTKHLVT